MRVIIFLLAFFTFIRVFGQQEPLSSMFWNNYSVVNPANSGFNYRHFATVQGRAQWMSLDGYPKRLWAGYDVKIDAINSGIGVNYSYKIFGLVEESKIQLNYNYQFEFTEEHKLGIGVSFGYQRRTLGEDYFWNPDIRYSQLLYFTFRQNPRTI